MVTKIINHVRRFLSITRLHINIFDEFEFEFDDILELMKPAIDKHYENITKYLGENRLEYIFNDWSEKFEQFLKSKPYQKAIVEKISLSIFKLLEIKELKNFYEDLLIIILNNISKFVLSFFPLNIFIFEKLLKIIKAHRGDEKFDSIFENFFNKIMTKTPLDMIISSMNLYQDGIDIQKEFDIINESTLSTYVYDFIIKFYQLLEGFFKDMLIVFLKIDFFLKKKSMLYKDDAISLGYIIKRLDFDTNLTIIRNSIAHQDFKFIYNQKIDAAKIIFRVPRKSKELILNFKEFLTLYYKILSVNYSFIYTILEILSERDNSNYAFANLLFFLEVQYPEIIKRLNQIEGFTKEQLLEKINFPKDLY